MSSPPRQVAVVHQIAPWELLLLPQI